MAPRPSLYPLKTPDNITFPSELQEYIRATSNPEPSKQRGDGKGPSVPPPRAYTEFLKALSPTFGSPPQSATTAYSNYSFNNQLPSPASSTSSASTLSFPGEMLPGTHTRSIPQSPLNEPRSAGEPGPIHHIPVSPTYSYSPRVESPKSAHPARSPYPFGERKVRYLDSSSSTTEVSIRTQHVITHTITFKRVPPLDPPPKGKRRKGNQMKSDKLRS
ncbi:hypothetical protein ARAM_006281 [Aspergillus rambellii]|uniref:Uncharacterized protein n=1 Tax=Aspergillus rambellii TaxID=308745 RepID=A0A0F8U932_9EURO|nr:hypothetical protein ARAM_006281 [Aspergillus rambellii]